MSNLTRAEIIDLIGRVQAGAGGGEDLKAIERATENPNAWFIFNVLETDGMAPDKLFDLFFAKRQTATA